MWRTDPLQPLDFAVEPAGSCGWTNTFSATSPNSADVARQHSPEPPGSPRGASRDTAPNAFAISSRESDRPMGSVKQVGCLCPVTGHLATT